jgi:hypothetical protein
VAQAETGELVYFLGGFAISWISFLVSCGMLHPEDATEIVINIYYILFDPLERTQDAQPCLD